MKTLTGRRILLVGGAGFIGHHLALRIKDLGAQVFVVDSLAVNNYYAFKQNADSIPHSGLYLHIIQERLRLLKERAIPVIEVDSRDYHRLSKAVAEIDPDTLVHLAAVSHADKSNKDPFSTFDHSLRTVENSLDVARSKALNIKHFIYFSSSMVYGDFASNPVTEEGPCNPIGIYGAIKFAAEKIVIAYNQVFNLPYTIIRPSALYGPRCVSCRVGQIFIENALQGLEISICGDGTDRLDFSYIDDLVSGVVKVLQNENSKNQVFNLTYGESRSIAEMADILTKQFPGVKIRYLPRDKLTPVRGTLCVKKAKRLLGYRSQYPLERGFVEYIRWYKSVWQTFNAGLPRRERPMKEPMRGTQP